MKNEIIKAGQENAFNRLLQFCNGEDITLDPVEEQIFHRWNIAHKFFLQRKLSSEQIAEKIKELFNVSIYTARNDVNQSRALFGASLKANKRYALHHHAEWLLMYMKKCSEDKSLATMVPKLAREYTLAIDKMPEDNNRNLMPPPIMVFHIVDGQRMDIKKNSEEVIQQLRIKYGHSHEYIDPIEEKPNDAAD